MKKLIIIFMYLGAILFFKEVNAQTCNKDVIGYFYGTNTERSNLVNVSTIDYTKYTKIFYAFFYPGTDGHLLADPGTDPSAFLTTTSPTTNTAYLVGMAKSKGCSVYVSIGGNGNSDNFSAVTADHTVGGKLSVFISDIVSYVNNYGFDGVDIDWETPGTGDASNYTYMLQQLRSSLPSGKKISITVYSDYWDAEVYQWDQFFNTTDGINLDMVNAMTYDYFTPGGQCSETDHNAPLTASLAPSPGTADVALCGSATYGFFTTATTSQVSFTTPNYYAYDTESGECTTTTNYNYSYYGLGIPADKLNLGLAFYGYSWQDATALHQTGSFTAADASFLPSGNYFDIFDNLSNFTQNWDTDAQVPYLLHASNTTYAHNVLVSYDNERSIGAKANYVLNTNTNGYMNGVLIWRIQSDYIETSPGSGVIAYTPLVDKVNAIFGRAVSGNQSYNAVRSPSTNPLPAYTGRTGYIQAGGSPTSFVSVQAQTTTEVTFTAGTYVELDPGFYAPSGSVFTASINSSLCYENPARLAAQSFRPEPGNATTTVSSETVSLYPNPTTGLVGLNVNYGQQKGDVSVTVYNPLGAEIYSADLGSIAIGHTDINLSAEPAGLYIVKVKADSDVQYRKVVLSK